MEERSSEGVEASERRRRRLLSEFENRAESQTGRRAQRSGLGDRERREEGPREVGREEKRRVESEKTAGEDGRVRRESYLRKNGRSRC